MPIARANGDNQGQASDRQRGRAWVTRPIAQLSCPVCTPTIELAASDNGAEMCMTHSHINDRARQATHQQGGWTTTALRQLPKAAIAPAPKRACGGHHATVTPANTQPCDGTRKIVDRRCFGAVHRCAVTELPILVSAPTEQLFTCARTGEILTDGQFNDRLGQAGDTRRRGARHGGAIANLPQTITAPTPAFAGVGSRTAMMTTSANRCYSGQRANRHGAIGSFPRTIPKLPSVIRAPTPGAASCHGATVIVTGGNGCHRG